jgi:predicted aspartyl protease
MFEQYLLAAALAAATAASPSPSPVQNEGTVANTQTLQLDPDGHERLTVSITIGGQGPFDFLIDTGAQATVLSRELADRLQLTDRMPALLIGLASQVQTETVAVDDMMLGRHNFNVAMAPLLDAEDLGTGVDGILGLDGLQRRRVLIDFIKRKIDVADADELGGNRGYEIVVKARRRLGQLIITDAQVDGVRTAVLVDTGAQSSVINRALLDRLRSRSRGTTQLIDVNGTEIEGPLHVLRSFRIDDLSISGIPAFVVDSPAFKALGIDDKPAMILGMRELKLFRRVAIDFDSRRILFDIPRSAQDFNTIIGAKIG